MEKQCYHIRLFEGTGLDAGSTGVMSRAMAAPPPCSGSLSLKSLGPAVNIPGSGGNLLVSRALNTAVL